MIMGVIGLTFTTAIRLAVVLSYALPAMMAGCLVLAIIWVARVARRFVRTRVVVLVVEGRRG